MLVEGDAAWTLAKVVACRDPTTLLDPIEEPFDPRGRDE
jgi:hypothetical protein